MDNTHEKHGRAARAAPGPARCDFCGRVFPRLAWNSRTCLSCRDQGAPDQSLTATWSEYEEKAVAWSRSRRPARKPKPGAKTGVSERSSRGGGR
jgi:hypothetical protein